MTLRIAGNEKPFGIDILDTESGKSILAALSALQVRVVIDNEGARLEVDQAVHYDFTVPGEVKAFIRCPETGKKREIEAIALKDGGVIDFPRDFSSSAEAEEIEKALPKTTADA